MDLFTAIDVTKKFANHTALNNLSINVPENSIFGLLGPNGAGKTTLIRIINQITAPDSGQLFFKGEKLIPDHVSQIGYLPEERGLYKKMKVGEQAMYLAQLKGLRKSEAFKKLKFWFEKFEIVNWWNKRVEELSKGMQQKVQFIVTIIHEPKLLIFDEPFSGFDPINTKLLKDEILKLKNDGATIIFSTHNMASVEEICDHIALIDNAEKILDGRVNDIRKKYRSNTYSVKLSSFNTQQKNILHEDFSILENIIEDGVSTLKIKISEKSSPKQLIENLIQHAELLSFNEIIPSMDDIFIANVGKKNQ